MIFNSVLFAPPHNIDRTAVRPCSRKGNAMSQVCDCWGMTRKKIEQAVRENGLKSAQDVYDHFEGVECGVCTADVEAIVDEVLSSEEA